MSNHRCWVNVYDAGTGRVCSRYLKGYSHAHSHKVWRELPEHVRRYNRFLTRSLQFTMTDVKPRIEPFTAIYGGAGL